jgi:hypothetical protein
LEEKTYEVTLYFSTCVTLEVRAGSGDEAIEKARTEVDLDVNHLTEEAAELLQNLEPWEECDEVQEVGA